MGKLKKSTIAELKRLGLSTDWPDEQWAQIDGDVEVIVAHFRDGHKMTMPVYQFLALTKKKDIVQIDCYKKDEKWDS